VYAVILGCRTRQGRGFVSAVVEVALMRCVLEFEMFWSKLFDSCAFVWLSQLVPASLAVNVNLLGAKGNLLP